MLECYRGQCYNVITITEDGLRSSVQFSFCIYVIAIACLDKYPLLFYSKAKSSMIDGMLFFAFS